MIFPLVLAPLGTVQVKLLAPSALFRGWRVGPNSIFGKVCKKDWLLPYVIAWWRASDELNGMAAHSRREHHMVPLQANAINQSEPNAPWHL